jgi:hypothetical protein
MKTVRERKIVPLIEKEIVDKQVCDGDNVEKTKTSVNCRLEFHILRFVHPLKY